MEFCDQGTLRQALDRGRLKNPRTGRTHLPVALALARDVVRWMGFGGGGGWRGLVQTALVMGVFCCSQIVSWVS